MAGGRNYAPTLHRVKVLYSIELKPEELRTLWVSTHKREPFSIRRALNFVRRELEEHGASAVLRRAGAE